MKGFLDLLARAKLVELSPEEQSRTPSAAPEVMPAPTPAAPSAAAAPPPPQPIDAGGKEAAAPSEGRTWEEVFLDAGVPPSVFPAEKLLRLLDGLRAMDAATRKAAVLAMDAADDNWTIDDCLIDAQRKMAALEAYKQQLAAHLRSGEQQTGEQIAAVKAGLEQSTTAIRQQISELEQLLEREVSKAAQQTTSLEAALRAARESLARETRRIDGEIERLREIPTQFSAAPAAH